MERKVCTGETMELISRPHDEGISGIDGVCIQTNTQVMIKSRLQFGLVGQGNIKCIVRVGLRQNRKGRDFKWSLSTYEMEPPKNRTQEQTKLQLPHYSAQLLYC